MNFKVILCWTLIFSTLIPMTGPIPVAFAAAAADPHASFADLLTTYRGKLDSSKDAQTKVIADFAEALIANGTTVSEVDGYVKGQLSAREYEAYHATLDRALRGIDQTRLS